MYPLCTEATGVQPSGHWSAAAGPSNAQRSGAPYYHHGAGYAPSGSGYPPPTQTQRPSHRACKNGGCTKPVYDDPTYGAFDYCSPQCRDAHLLGSERERLQRDIEEYTKQSRSSSLPTSGSIGGGGGGGRGGSGGGGGSSGRGGSGSGGGGGGGGSGGGGSGGGGGGGSGGGSGGGGGGGSGYGSMPSVTGPSSSQQARLDSVKNLTKVTIDKHGGNDLGIIVSKNISFSPAADRPAVR